MATEPTLPWHRIEEVWLAVADLPVAEREAELDKLGDPALAAEVRSLLAAEAQASGLVDDAVAEAGAEWVVGASSLPDLGAYRPLHELGRGGFGVVYLAERQDQDFRMNVAVKLLHRGYDDTDLEARMLRERQILARLQHPNIARLLDVGTAGDGRPFLVMEHIEGEPVDHWCDGRSLDVAGRLGIMIAICDAVSYAHRNLVVHRDLKPSNILVDKDGVPKLLDFGIAKVLSSELPGAAGLATRTGRLPLTPQYASPEQIQGQALSTVSDVYSLGVVLYRLLTGRPPYELEEGSVLAIERVVVETEPPRPSVVAASGDGTDAARRGTVPSGLSRLLQGDLDAVVAMALHKDPERRYPSVDHLAEDLRRHLDGRPVSAQGDSFSYRLQRFVRRYRWGVAAAAVLVLSLSAGIVGTTYQMQVARRHQDRAEQVTRLLVDDVFGSASPGEAPGRALTAREILDQSVVGLDRRAVDAPDLHGTLLVAVGRLYQELGEYAKAETLIQRGAEQLRRVHGETDPEMLRARSALADVWLDRGRFRASADMLEAVVEVQRNVGSKLDLATSLYRLAMVERKLDDGESAARRLDKALALVQDASDSRRLLEDPLQEATFLSLAAKLALDQGRFKDAEGLYQEVLAVRRAHLSPLHPDLLVTMNDLAVLAYRAQNFEVAAVRFRELVDANIKVHGEGHRNQAVPLLNLGNALTRLGRHAEAAVALENAWRIRSESLGPSHASTSVARRQLAGVLFQLGRRDEAERHLRAQLDLLTGDTTVERPRHLHTLAMVRAEADDWSAAESSLAQAVAEMEARVEPENENLAVLRVDWARALCRLGRRSRGTAEVDAALKVLMAGPGPDNPNTRTALQLRQDCSQ